MQKPGRCLFPHHQVDEQPNKKRKKGYYSHKRRESDDKNAVAIVKIVPQLGCVSQDSEALVSQRGKQPQRNPMQSLGTDSKNTIHSVYATSSKYKGSSLGQIQVKNPHQRSPYAMTLEDRTLPKNIYKLKENETATFYSPAEELVLLAASTKEPEEREFVVDSGARVHVVSEKDPNSAESETMRTSRSPTTVMTANGEVQTREEATVNVKQLNLFVKVMLLEENSRSSFQGETV